VFPHGVLTRAAVCTVAVDITLPFVAGVLHGRYMSSTSYMSTPGIGTNTLVKNECWGLAAVPAGGYVLGCGTGIENCVGATGDLLTKCKADAPMLADTRAGAFARSPASARAVP